MPTTILLFDDLAAAAARLAADLAEEPCDPFDPVPLVVGSRAIGRWLRHELATRMDIAASVQVLPVAEAIDRAIASLETERPWWQAAPTSDDPWRGAALRARVLAAFRAVRGARFEPLRRYLFGGKTPESATSWRELSLAGEVAAALERLVRERPEDVAAWCAGGEAFDGDPDAAGWLAGVCAALDLAAEGSPLARRLALRRSGGAAWKGPALRIVGATGLSAGERADLEALGNRGDVRWYRAVAAPGRWSEDGDEHPLLRGLARVERAERGWTRGRWAADAAPSPGPTGPKLLARLQASVRADAPFEGVPVDDSLSFHRTFGPLRQVEVLRDTLLRWFAEDATLEPRDVAVLTPNLEAYAPLVAAVFARRGRAAGDDEDLEGDDPLALADADAPSGSARASLAPAIPVRIGDLGLSQTNPVADVLLRVLELTQERVTAPLLLALLSAGPLRQRFGLGDDDVDDLRALVVDSNLRWGLDEADRDAAGQPALHQNTVDFGLERLALGVLMPAEGLEGALLDAAGRRPVVPMPLEGRERARRVAALAALIAALREARGQLGEDGDAADAEGWRTRIDALLDRFTATSKAATWLRLEVMDALDEVLPRTAGPQLQLTAVRRLLQGRFELGRSGGRVIGSAVTVARLGPHAATPARVVALLGMDDGTFPRAPVPRAWDPFRTPRDGEHDPRSLDRQALLDTLLSARDRVFVSWAGFELKKGAELPACVPVEELVDAVAAAAGRKRDELVRTHPRQPWSPRAFVDGEGGFDGGMIDAARALRGALGKPSLPSAGIGTSRLAAEDLPEEDNPPTDLPLDELSKALCTPSRTFLYDRLGVWVAESDGPVPEREPLALGHLDGWQVSDEILRLVRAGDASATTPEALLQRFAGRGILPLEAGGRAAAEDALELVTATVARWTDLGGAASLPADDPAASIRHEIDGLRLAGRVDRVRRSADGALLLEWLVAGKVGAGKRALRAWVHLLAACATAEDGVSLAGARILGVHGKEPETWLAAPSKDDAAAMLADLVAVWRRARRRPLPLFEKTSAALAAGLPAPGQAADPKKVSRARGKVASAWEGSSFGGNTIPGEREDRQIAALWAGWSPLDGSLDPADAEPFGFVDLAARVWAPLIRAVDKSLAADWSTP